MRIRELRKPKSDSDLSAEEISRKIGAEFRETKRHRPEAERTDAKGPPAERRTGSGQRRSVEPVGDVKRPVEGGTAESYSKIVADLYRSKRRQVGGEEAGITKSADGNPRECRIQHDSSPIHAAADTISGIGTEREDTIDLVRKECQTTSQNRKKCLTANDVEDIRKMYFEDGLSLTRIAIQLGVGRTTVSRVFEREGWSVRFQPHGPKPKKEDYGKIRHLYFEERLSQYEVAKEVGVSRRQIQRAFEAQGWTPRPRGGRPGVGLEVHEKSRELYFDQGLSLAQVARYLGLSAVTIGRVLKREGWPARPQRGRTKWDDETIRKTYFDESAVQKDDAARHSRVQPQRKKVDRNEAYRLHFEENLPLQAIAERLSASVRTIGRIFREEGWVPRGLQKTSERDERSCRKHEYEVARRQEIASIRETVFGSKCRLCGETSDRFSIHRKNGEKHVSSLFQSPARLRALNPEEWAYVDLDCHFAVHLMMNNLGYDWARIERLTGNLRERTAYPPEIRSAAKQSDSDSEKRIRFADAYAQSADDLRRTMFGNRCTICGKDENEVHLVAHRKDGEAHDPQMLRSRKYLLTCDPAEWVALCIPCHYVTHWAMRRFHANWEQIRAAFLTDN